MPVQLQCIQLITDKTNVADKSSSVFAILISVTLTIKIHNSLLLYKFCQKLANSDVTEELLNCTASLLQLTAFLTLLVS